VPVENEKTGTFLQRSAIVLMWPGLSLSNPMVEGAKALRPSDCEDNSYFEVGVLENFITAIPFKGISIISELLKKSFRNNWAFSIGNASAL
jgi:hypothetical protein